MVRIPRFSAVSREGVTLVKLYPTYGDATLLKE